ncbi:RICIN domain-containing protein [Streptomyces sp. NPDC006335]|uniref:RICIN domain-containing protein n=1 Tax=Streptomyces sp. NPDC006335 TaxID=3156895 RepID=UPI0033A642C7
MGLPGAREAAPPATHRPPPGTRHALFLQPTGTATGADIVQQADTSATSQQWRVVDHGGDVISLVTRKPDLAMDVW